MHAITAYKSLPGPGKGNLKSSGLNALDVNSFLPWAQQKSESHVSVFSGLRSDVRRRRYDFMCPSINVSSLPNNREQGSKASNNLKDCFQSFLLCGLVFRLHRNHPTKEDRFLTTTGENQ